MKVDPDPSLQRLRDGLFARLLQEPGKQIPESVVHYTYRRFIRMRAINIQMGLTMKWSIKGFQEWLNDKEPEADPKRCFP